MARGGQNKISREDLLKALRNLAEEIGKTPTGREMAEQGLYSVSAYRGEFGSWNKALEAVDLEKNRPSNPEYIDIECDYCSTSLKKLKSSVTGQKHTFCSRDCKHDYQSENIVGKNHHQYSSVDLECDWCEDSFTRKPSLVNEDENCFCSYECMGAWRTEHWVGPQNARWKGGEIALSCEFCGKEYRVRQAREGESRFCSYKCLYSHRTEATTGPNNPNWKGGYSPYYGPNWRRQRERRLEIDDYQCRDCGLTNVESLDCDDQELSIHHKIPIREFRGADRTDYEAANELGNLVTLCVKCHAKWENLPVQPEFKI